MCLNKDKMLLNLVIFLQEIPAFLGLAFLRNMSKHRRRPEQKLSSGTHGVTQHVRAPQSSKGARIQEGFRFHRGSRLRTRLRAFQQFLLHSGNRSRRKGALAYICLEVSGFTLESFCVSHRFDRCPHNLRNDVGRVCEQTKRS